MPLYKLLIVILATFWTMPVCAAEAAALTDVAISAHWGNVSSQQVPNGVIRLSVCALSLVNDSGLISRHENFNQCVEFSKLQASGTGVAPSKSSDFTVKNFYRTAVDHDIPMDDATLLVSFWVGHDGMNSDTYLDHKTVDILALGFGSKSSTTLSLKDPKSQAAAQIMFNSAECDINKSFADLNPPANIFNENVMATLLGKKAESLNVSDAFLASMLFYSNPQPEGWKQIASGDFSKPQALKLINAAHQTSKPGRLSRLVLIFQREYEKIIDSAVEKLRKPAPGHSYSESEQKDIQDSQLLLAVSQLLI